LELEQHLTAFGMFRGHHLDQLVDPADVFKFFSFYRAIDCCIFLRKIKPRSNIPAFTFSIENGLFGFPFSQSKAELELTNIFKIHKFA
jgi:hypothetical protein